MMQLESAKKKPKSKKREKLDEWLLRLPLSVKKKWFEEHAARSANIIGKITTWFHTLDFKTQQQIFDEYSRKRKPSHEYEEIDV